MRVTWDIFCSVVDNFGDIGVTWRLARQLVAEHDLDVRLWVDDLPAFARLCPELDVQAAEQFQQGVRVCAWPTLWLPVTPAAVVIEAFACALPAAYIAAMASGPRRLWLNLEYLSAEDWVPGCHALPSLQGNGLQKFFFFPGFVPQTGGLLREADLLERRRRFQQTPQLRQAFLARLGVNLAPAARLISLFAYENSGLASWLEALASAAQPTHLLVPEGRILVDLQRWLSGDPLAPGSLRVRGALTVQVLAFLCQDDYDRLLWSCDFNAVRGEDSFVRAQWAGRPMLWHIYPQEQGAHWDKLEAFLALYSDSLSPAAREALLALWRAWNAGEPMTEARQALQSVWSELSAQAENWCQRQAAQKDLAAGLVQFYLNWL